MENRKTPLSPFSAARAEGFVLGAPKQGYILSSEVSFIHYEDLGWTVSEIDD